MNAQKNVLEQSSVLHHQTSSVTSNDTLQKTAKNFTKYVPKNLSNLKNFYIIKLIVDKAS